MVHENKFILNALGLYGVLREAPADEQHAFLAQGGGVASGGLRELIPTVARTAVAVGVDGIFMEVRPPQY